MSEVKIEKEAINKPEVADNVKKQLPDPVGYKLLIAMLYAAMFFVKAYPGSVYN